MDDENFFQSDQVTPLNGEVKILDFTAQPYQDQSRVKIRFRLSSFQRPPNAAITLWDEEGEEVTSVDVVNIFQPDNEITLHIPRSQRGKKEYQVELKVFDLSERPAQDDEKGEIKLTTKNMASSRITFTRQ